MANIAPPKNKVNLGHVQSICNHYLEGREIWCYYLSSLGTNTLSSIISDALSHSGLSHHLSLSLGLIHSILLQQGSDLIFTPRGSVIVDLSNI